MIEFKGTPGPWSYRKTGEHWNNPRLINIEINFGNDGECIADTVYNEEDAKLIAAAPELLGACIRMRNQLYAAGYDSKEKSLNPTEELLWQTEQAIDKALGK